MKLFFSLPKNLIPSGGVKVHYQLCELVREMSFESFIVYDSISQLPQWFKYNVNHLSWSQMLQIANKKRDLIIGYENPEPLYRSGFQKKVAYIQGNALVNGTHTFNGITLWMSNKFIDAMLPQFQKHEKFFVTPFIDQHTFFTDQQTKKTTAILLQGRKDGQKCKMELSKTIETPITLLPDVNEADFAYNLRKTDIFVPHSYPEGFGLPGLEAMASGCIVCGFSGGGGSEYMQHGVNSFVAPDGNYDVLRAYLQMALDMSEKDKKDMLLEAKKTADFYSRKRTKDQLKFALSEYGEVDGE